MKKSILLLILFLNFSCNSSNFESELSNILSKDGGYWDFEWARDDADQHGFTFRFEKNGNLSKYSFDKAKNERRLFSDYPSKEIDDIWKWRVGSDTTLFFLGDSVKIKYFSNDTIVFSDKLSSKELLIRVKGDLIIK